MKLNSQKELTPIVYGESAVKILPTECSGAGAHCFGTHWHERAELLVVERGSINLTLGDRHECAFAGSVAVFMPGQPHGGFAGNDGVKYYAVMFDIRKFINSTDASEKYLNPLAEQRVPFSGVVHSEEIFSAAEELCREQLSGKKASSLVIMGEVYRILGLLYRDFVDLCEQPTAADSRFKDITEFIDRHCCEEISSATLSRRFGYDEAYFCRRFKAVTGLKPMEYIQILRLEHARKILEAEPEVKISELASLCGFSEPGYFARCFKKHYGTTPSAYAAPVKRNFR